MFILRIETVAEQSEVAIYKRNRKQKSRCWRSAERLGSDLLPEIINLLNESQLQLTDLSAISVNPGPGSFTGTRVGVAVANALAWSLNIPVVDQLPTNKLAEGVFHKPVESIYSPSKWLVEPN